MNASHICKTLFSFNSLCWSCCSTASLPRDEDSIILSHSLCVYSVDSSLRIVRIPSGPDSKPFPVLDEFLRTAADIPPEFREEKNVMSITRSSRCHQIKAHRWRNCIASVCYIIQYKTHVLNGEGEKKTNVQNNRQQVQLLPTPLSEVCVLCDFGISKQFCF